MSEPAANARRKVSREGVVLLKSFEGFRARAERDGDGWVIGYGHRRSAREGLSVGEADAELLLQYDLMPVVQALNALPVHLNTHQFDALASFAFSVGPERFTASDVHARLAEGRLDAAAEALLAWSEPSPAVAGLRRRAAERALFLADPERPVALADLLSAPLPTADPAGAGDARAAAVAALLGEADVSAPAEEAAAPGSAPDVVMPTFAPEAPPAAEAPPPTPAAERVAPPPIARWSQAYGVAVTGPLPGFGPASSAPAPATDMKPAPLPPADVAVEAPPAAEPVAETWPQPAASPFPTTAVEPLVLTPAPESDGAPVRPVWGDEERPAPVAAQDPLFVDAPSQTSILRHEAEPAEPRRFDWSETGMYVIMGGLGLVSCAVSAAAFRVAVEDPSPMGETTAVAWTLAVIGAVCVGAASWHLWVRVARRKG
ncbi:MAG TPA: glycoside hydrolase family protein [Brevundimonas sp.]|uniref:glycoside hydrolase family protein n=1 Tax=Brevundimonas sp. TaxID=1871086 RepID=UPI002DEEBDA6|nr:glycoside hydrolase family protein [Brevundimonas sp.]